eukprot:330404-Rhodomonas_salina.1
MWPVLNSAVCPPPLLCRGSGGMVTSPKERARAASARQTEACHHNVPGDYLSLPRLRVEVRKWREVRY